MDDQQLEYNNDTDPLVQFVSRDKYFQPERLLLQRSRKDEYNKKRGRNPTTFQMCSPFQLRKYVSSRSYYFCILYFSWRFWLRIWKERSCAKGFFWSMDRPLCLIWKITGKWKAKSHGFYYSDIVMIDRCRAVLPAWVLTFIRLLELTWMITLFSMISLD